MSLIIILMILSFLICYFLVLSANIQIYQQNYYKNKFQLKWIKKNIKKILLKNILLLVNIPFVLLGNIGYILSIISYIFVGYLNIIKNAKKPLIYTSRVIRLIITSYIFAILVYVVLVIFANNILGLMILPVICFLTPILIVLFNLINKPINKYINNRYINEAKEIINGMPNLIVIGITGSYGKTSMKNYLYKLLSEKYNVLITPENYNTTLGVVKTIREKLRATHNIFICEMGACNIGDIKEICDIVKPKYGVITSIGEQHLATFKSIDNIIKTKFELADALPSDGKVFLNYDNKYIKENNSYKNVITYGIKNEDKKDYEAYEGINNNNGIEFKVDNNNQEYIFSTKLLGDHNVTNLIGAISVANTLGIPMEKLIAKVRQIEPVPHRLQLSKNANGIIIDDAYNSNPAGAKSALEALNKFNGTKILITPGMIELGEKEYEYNFEFGVNAVDVCDYIILVGEKQTKPIYDGIVSKKYNMDNLIIVEDVKFGIKKAYSINTNGKQRIILLENDLPDNY